jgi:two-component system response regulator FixJ
VGDRIHIVDDDPGLSASLRMLLESASYRVETYASAREFLAQEFAGAAERSCLITDVQMPDMDGLALQGELVRRGLAIPVIVMTGHADVPRAVKAMKAGAIDFLEKPFEDTALLDSVARALEAASRAGDRTGRAQQARERLASLTERERQVLELLVAGKANKVIAYELAISPRTVELHRARVMDKMAAGNLADLVRLRLAVEDAAG